MLLGAVIVMTFASLIDVGRAPGITSGDRENLTTMGAVVGVCGLVIVLFSVSTTMTLGVRQRGAEIALLKSVGATPSQVRRMICGEAALLSAVAWLLAIPISIFAGRALMRFLVSAGLVAAGTPYRFGAAALGVGVSVTVVAGTAAAWMAAQRTAGMGVAEALLTAEEEQPRMRNTRVAAGCAFLAAGASAAGTSAVLLRDSDLSILQL